MKNIKAIFIDIFDGDDDNSFYSKIYLRYEVTLILGLLLLISSNQIIEQFHASIYTSAYTIFILIFNLQFFTRLILIPSVYSLSKSTKNVKSKIIKPLLIDVFAGVIPMCVIMFSESNIYHVSLISAVKIIRLFDVLPGFLFLKKAVQSKKEEILYSVLLVVFASFILSCLIYFLESNNPQSPFKSVLDTLIWSFSKYTNDYGLIANFAPYSNLAKFFATINGLLGVAVFAVPGALLSSAFIEQITEKKRMDKIIKRENAIVNKFKESLWEIVQLSEKNIPSSRNLLTPQLTVYDRFWTFDALKSEFLYNENEILEVLRYSTNLSYKVLTNKNANGIVRQNIVELNCYSDYFEKQKRKTSYGLYYYGSNSEILFISSRDTFMPCKNHFASTLSKIADINFISQTEKIRDKVTDNSWNFASCQEYLDLKESGNSEDIPSIFNDFLEDIDNAVNHKKCRTVIILRTASSGRGATKNNKGYDVHYTFGLDNSISSDFDKGSIKNTHKNKALFECLKTNLSNVSRTTRNYLKENISFSLATHEFQENLSDSKYLSNILFEKYSSLNINCIQLFVSRDIIEGWGEEGDATYYALMRALKNTFNNFNEITNNTPRTSRKDAQ
jgi:voltage-gated potassium channel